MRIVVAAVIVVFAAVVARAEDKPATPSAPPDINEVVARVNGKEIKRQELAAAEQSFAMQLAQRGRPIAGAQMGQFEADVLEELIGRQLVLQEGLKRTIPDLDEKVKTEVAALKKSKGGDEGFAKALVELKTTEAELAGKVREGLILQDTMENLFKSKSSVSADDVKKFYDENQPKFQRPEQARASHILIRGPAEAPQKEKDEKRARIDVIKTRLSQGEKFADVAKQVSEDPGSALCGNPHRDPGGEGMRSREKIATANGIDICADAFGDRSHPAILLTPDHRLEVATQIPGASTEPVAWR